MEYMEARMQDRYEALSEKAVQASDRATPKYMIAHGSAAVQAARIIAAVAKEREDKARGYEMAAQWHDKQEKACREIAGDSPRIDAPTRAKAATAAIHHGASAAGLRNAASALRRLATTE